MIPGETKHFISGSADNSLRFWDCETATTLSKYETKTAVRACGFSYSGTSIMMTTDRQMGHDCFIFIYDIREGIFTDFVLQYHPNVSYHPRARRESRRSKKHVQRDQDFRQTSC